MWALKNAEGALLYVNPEKGLQVGRKQGDLVLPTDESISRSHAKVFLENPSNLNHERNPTIECFVKDIGSKYGSFVIRDNKKEKVPKEDFPLRHLDKLQFGLQHNVFTVLHIPLVVAASGLTNAEKAELRSLLAKVNGVVSDTWSTCCTHLTVPQTTAMTQKVACALAQAVPIVTLTYWKDVLKAIAANQEFPKSSEYMAAIGENAISKERVSLDCDSRRTKLFQDKIFVHHTAVQYNFYARIIKAAGGKSLWYSKKPLNEREICAENVIVLQPNEESSQTMNSTNNTLLSDVELIQRTLKKKNKRLVSDSEIPLAILYCSIERYCNPKYKFSTVFKQTNLKEKSNQSQTLAPDTQDLSQPPEIGKSAKSAFVPLATSTQRQLIIPETVEEEEKHLEELSQIVPPPVLQDGCPGDVVIPETPEKESQKPTPKVKQSIFSMNRPPRSAVAPQESVTEEEVQKPTPKVKQSIFSMNKPSRNAVATQESVTEEEVVQKPTPKVKQSIFSMNRPSRSAVAPQESVTEEEPQKPTPKVKQSIFSMNKPSTSAVGTQENLKDSKKIPEKKNSPFVVEETQESLTLGSSKKRYRSEEDIVEDSKKVPKKDCPFVVEETQEEVNDSKKVPEKKNSPFVVEETQESMTLGSSKKRYRSQEEEEEDEEFDEISFGTKKVCSEDQVSRNRSIFSKLSNERSSIFEVNPKKKVSSWSSKKEKEEREEENRQGLKPKLEPEPESFNLEEDTPQVSSPEADKVENLYSRKSNKRKFEEDRVVKKESKFAPVSSVYSDEEEEEKKWGTKRKVEVDAKEEPMDGSELKLYRQGQIKCVLVSLFREGYDENNPTKFLPKPFKQNCVKIPKKRITLSDTYVYFPSTNKNILDGVEN